MLRNIYMSIPCHFWEQGQQQVSSTNNSRRRRILRLSASGRRKRICSVTVCLPSDVRAAEYNWRCNEIDWVLRIMRRKRIHRMLPMIVAGYCTTDNIWKSCIRAFKICSTNKNRSTMCTDNDNTDTSSENMSDDSFVEPNKRLPNQPMRLCYIETT
jgi:hypothetical protein